MFRHLENLLKKAEEKKGILRYQRSLLGALDTFARRPAIVTGRSPHMRDATDLKRYMSIVVLALLPCVFFGIWNTGRSAYLSIGDSSFSFWQAFLEGAIHVVPLILISYAVGGFCEMLFAQIRGHEIAEGFLVTGMLYPLICPPTIPWWMYITGIVFGVIIGKEVFGGTGQNILNPGLTARAFLFFAYPAAMSGDVWIVKPVSKLADGTLAAKIWTTIPGEKIQAFIDGAARTLDGFSGPTPLLIAGENAVGVNSVVNLHETYSTWDMFLGLIPGSIGETSTLMCLIGALILIVTGVGSWRVMLGVFAGGVITAGLFFVFAGESSPSMFSLAPVDHLVMGGFAFGAIFMATDPVSGPLHDRSKLIYGFLIGMLCILIRLINPAFPEGMMLSILFMNIFAALIDHYVIKRAQRRRVARAG